MLDKDKDFKTLKSPPYKKLKTASSNKFTLLETLSLRPKANSYILSFYILIIGKKY